MKRMSPIAAVFAAMVFVSPSQGGQSNVPPAAAPTGENIEQLLTDLIIQWGQVNFSHDTSVLERILAPDLIFVGDDPEGLSGGYTWGKQDLIAYDKTDTNKYSAAEIRNVRVRAFGADFAVSTGDYHVAGVDQSGKRFDRTARFTNVWVRRNGSWQVVSGHNNWIPAKN